MDSSHGWNGEEWMDDIGKIENGETVPFIIPLQTHILLDSFELKRVYLNQIE